MTSFASRSMTAVALQLLFTILTMMTVMPTVGIFNVVVNAQEVLVVPTFVPTPAPPTTSQSPTNTPQPTATPWQYDLLTTPRCGDCWCIINSAANDDEDCPNDTIDGRIKDTFTELQGEVYSTFQLTNPNADFLTLKPIPILDAFGQPIAGSSSGPCYPFANVTTSTYTESQFRQCVLPTSAAAVCGYVYDDDDDAESSSCDGRQYEIRNFASVVEATAANADIIHQGGTLHFVTCVVVVALFGGVLFCSGTVL
jgi:hypothetical protein